MLPAQLHLQRGLSLLWLSSYTSHVTLQAAEKVRGHLFCGLRAGLFFNQQTSGPVCRHPVQKDPREPGRFAWCLFLSGQTFLKWKQQKPLQERPYGYGHPSSPPSQPQNVLGAIPALQSEHYSHSGCCCSLAVVTFSSSQSGDVHERGNLDNIEWSIIHSRL